MLLSFKADVFERVKSGEKIYEHRRVFPDEPVKAYLYVSTPVKSIVGIMRLDAMVENAEREGLKQRIAEMQQFLAEQTKQIEEYDETLVRRMIEKITVYEDRFTVEFKSGTSVDVKR